MKRLRVTFVAIVTDDEAEFWKRDLSRGVESHMGCRIRTDYLHERRKERLESLEMEEMKEDDLQSNAQEASC